MKAVTIFGALTIASVAAVTWFRMQHQTPPLPVLGQVPDFALVERSGESVTLASLRGKVWLADFVYSTCPGPCPAITTNVAALQGDALAIGPDVRLVSFSIDPAKDTPEVLRKYAEAYGATDRWLFLTGDPAKVETLVTKGFMISIARPEGQPIIHGTHLALIDRSGRIRAFFEGTNAEQRPKILAALRQIARER
jgi:protein SCO1/2